MTLPNSSVAITTGAGTAIATHTVGDKEVQAVAIADESGHLMQTSPTETCGDAWASTLFHSADYGFLVVANAGSETAALGVPATKTDAAAELPTSWLLELWKELVHAGQQWLDPHVSSSDDETLFEWWCEDRKLSVYHLAAGIELIRVWGANMDTEMQTIENPDMECVLDAWKWLRGR